MEHVNPNDSIDYRVWTDMTGQPWAEAPARWSIVAQFRFLLDAIDYIAEISKPGTPAVLTGPGSFVAKYPRS